MLLNVSRLHSLARELVFKFLILSPEVMKLAMERFVILFNFNLDNFDRFSKSNNFFI